MNSVNIMGRLVTAPELRYTQNNTPVCTFRMAYNTRYGGKEESHFFSVVAWRNTAEFIAKYFDKGGRIAITGELQQRTYEKNGENRSVVEILAKSAYFCESRKNTRQEADFEECGTQENDFQEYDDDGDVPF